MFKSLVYLCETYNVNEVIFAGGVSASKYILRELSMKLRKKHIEAYLQNHNIQLIMLSVCYNRIE
nr:hypothetical protein [Clostridioides difficile]